MDPGKEVQHPHSTLDKRKPERRSHKDCGGEEEALRVGQTWSFMDEPFNTEQIFNSSDPPLSGSFWGTNLLPAATRYTSGVARCDLMNRKDNSRTGLHQFLRPVAGGNGYTREMDTDHTS